MDLEAMQQRINETIEAVAEGVIPVRLKRTYDNPKPLPQPGYVVLHSGPIEVGTTVRVIELGDLEPIEHMGLVTSVDGSKLPHAG